MKRRMLFVALAMVLVLQSAVFATLRVHCVDVGQGDAVVVESPVGRQIIYDGGPGAQTLSEYMEAMHLTELKLEHHLWTHAQLDPSLRAVIRSLSYDLTLDSAHGILRFTYFARGRLLAWRSLKQGRIGLAR